ncbi:hypothetical protein CEXT_530301 [Caerostris extrusa]|uniref:MATH domain-containing protein n=1 Tax=Caerostris extrusa TaxID=172846 RepID=A0AAV4XUB9_CAEEX|nr:hypothetical protein CEXT_530301 [Caerostris extrusa]
MASVSQEKRFEEVEFTDEHDFLITYVIKKASTLRRDCYCNYVYTRCPNFSRWYVHIIFAVDSLESDMVNLYIRQHREDDEEYLVTARVDFMVFYDRGEQPHFWQSIARPFTYKSFIPKSYQPVIAGFKIVRQSIPNDELIIKIRVRVYDCCKLLSWFENFEKDTNLNLESDTDSESDSVNDSESDAENDSETDGADDSKMGIAKDSKANLTDDSKINVADDSKINVADDSKINVTDDSKIKVAKDSEINVAKDSKMDVAKDSKMDVAKDSKMDVAKDSKMGSRNFSKRGFGRYSKMGSTTFSKRGFGRYSKMGSTTFF